MLDLVVSAPNEDGFQVGPIFVGRQPIYLCRVVQFYKRLDRIDGRIYRFWAEERRKKAGGEPRHFPRK
tara:strand:+ start:206 stop:409 length:204 start_codon:yes stop_codon:yes gene_type:complete